MSVLLDTYEQLPFEVVSGSDVWVEDANGNRYLDLYGGHAVALLGHSPKGVIDAMEAQARRLFFYSNIVPVKIRERAAERLAHFAHPSFRHIFFCNSGAEANENALKFAIKTTGRSKLVSYKGSFHGRTLLATAVTDWPATIEQLKGWVGDKVAMIEPNNPDHLHHIDNDTAAVILEPIQSIGGVVEFEDGYLKALRARCDRVGAFLVFDEVQTGMGRAGRPFISGFSGILPDMFTTAKGIACGYPVGALFLSDKLASEVKQGDLGSTYGGGPVAMAAVLATVEEIQERKLVENAHDIGTYAREALTPLGITVRGRGCLIGLELPAPAKGVMKALLSRKIITGTSKNPHVLRLLPPITVTRAHIEMLRDALPASIGEAQA